jgi:RND family efflux transporter MFP subunit
MGRTPMTVDVSRVARRDLVDYITVVGNLIGEQTVDVTPRVAGRIESVAVKLGDRVARGQTVAKIEDREIREQINQAQATLDVNKATVVQRESDLKVLESALDRNRTSYDRGLVAKQVLEDVEARHNAAVAQVSVAKAQQASTQARIDELKITLSNTTILSPLDGFVSRRNLDVGAFAGANTVILTVVDLGTVRLVANLVEKGFRRVVPGVDADVEVDSFQGETFHGQVSRVAPAFDPATRTAPMEIEVPNPGFRLKPGMYARVRLTVERRPQSLTVPRAAVVDTEGKRGVFVVEGQTARFREVQTGLQDGDHLEILSGLDEGTPVVTLGALALKDGDRVALPGDPGQAGGSPRGGGEGAAPGARSGRGGRGGGRQGQGGDARGK